MSDRTELGTVGGLAGTLSGSAWAQERVRVERVLPPVGSLTEESLRSTPAWRVEVDDDVTTWARPLIDQLNALAYLGEGWDSYGAEPPREKAARGSIELLTAMNFRGPVPHVSATPDGEVHLEWSTSGCTLQIEVSAGGHVAAALLDEGDEVTEWETGFVGDPRLSIALERVTGLP